MLSLLVGRMYYLQVLEADRYKTLSEENRISMRILQPTRGQILDRQNIPLAVNEPNYRIILIPEQTRDIGKTLQVLKQVTGITENETKRILRDLKRRCVTSII